ncbi:MAG: NAD(P)-dependent oxidoreductase [Planctomycetota bacterium]
MKCAILGASGFIGKHLGNHLRHSGHDVTGFDILLPRRTAGGDHPENSFPIISCDVMNSSPDLPPNTDAVFYLSQSPHYRDFPNQADHLFGVNTIGALRTIMAARDRGARFFCYASSGNVYSPSFQPLPEEHPARRDNAYALSKISGEEALALFSKYMPVTCARFFGVFGPRQANMLVPNIINRIIRRTPITLDRNPRNADDLHGFRISLCYVKDLVGILTTLAEKACAGTPPPAILNVAGIEPVSMRKLGEEIGHQLEIDPLFHLTDMARESDFIADIQRLRDFCSPAFTPLPQAIAKTLDHANPR